MSALVAGEVVVERLLRRHAGLLQLDDHEGQAVDEADQIRPAGVERPVTLNWLTSRKSLAAGFSQSMTANALGLLAAALGIGNGDRQSRL